MILQILHTLTGCLIIICFGSKLIIHYYLDHLHRRAIGIGYSLLNPLPYFLPYKSIVEDKYLLLKKTCNTLLQIAAVNLLLNLILGLLIYFA